MAKRGKLGFRRKTRNKLTLEKKRSDESDEDYRVDEDEEFDGSEAEYCSLDEDESEDSLRKFEKEDEEEEEWVEKKGKKVGRSSLRKCSGARKKNEVKKPRRKMVVISEEVEFDDFHVPVVKKRKKNKVSLKKEEDGDIEFLYKRRNDELANERPRKKSQVSKSEAHTDSDNVDQTETESNPGDMKFDDSDDEDIDYYDSGDEDDEEFSPGEVAKKTRNQSVKKQPPRRRKRSNPIKKSRNEKPASRKRRPIKRWVRHRRNTCTNTNSDSDFMCSGSSEYEYTISEEEREQVIEATEFCRRSTFRSSSVKSVKEEDLILPSKRRDPPGRKDKQKKVVAELSLETRKQVCGICLSEEAKGTVRGILNCCSHYFCFTCIMEWSKVESRCPLCKQRFLTISRTSRPDGSMDAVFPVAKRDQVYQPSEEELRSYSDPYENVLCTECHLGGDDALMLLCDLCDSPAHTYCIGLGHHVPDGNWYCDGCRPTALTSPSPAPRSPPPPAAAHEMFDLNEAYVPDTPLTPVAQSPRYPGHPPHISRSGAATLSWRRRIQRQIHQLLRSSIGRRDTVVNGRGEGVEGQASTSGVRSVGGFAAVVGSSHRQLHPCKRDAEQ